LFVSLPLHRDNLKGDRAYVILREVALLSLAAIGLLAVGIAVAFGYTDAIYVLVG
jgi:hypothetical protein